ncbi:TIR domain-containing protein [Streptomyces canus]|uniref:TIR domain-containing protein n=1 Tax=Streptomyces canus TaxID=58343 RepID=UPI00367730E2
MPKKFKVFVSWSGVPAQKCAKLLRDKLPHFNHLIEPFVSSEDIAKGDRGYDAIALQLRNSQFGIVCVTPENRREPWVNFEAGALSLEVGGKPKLAPLLLLGTTVADLVGTPLTQFQATSADVPDDVLSLIKTINGLCDPPADDKRVEDLFEKYWPELRDGLARIARDTRSEEQGIPPPRPTPDEIQDQMLTLLRNQVDRITSLEHTVDKLRIEQTGHLRRSVLFDGMFDDPGRSEPKPEPGDEV